MSLFRRRDRREQAPSDASEKERAAALKAEYDRAVDAEDVEAQDAALRQMVELKPEVAWCWFDLGLHAKWRHDWTESLRCNEKALALSTQDEGDPAAWNLGIAATALGEWATARRAWAAYGISLPDSEGPVQIEGGITPVRLNAQPRYPGQVELLLEGTAYAEEVVWCERICPTRAVVRNVPTPDSGHRFGDVVLHDGAPVGERRLADGSWRPVFDQILRLERSGTPTWLMEVEGDDDPGAERLAELADARGGYAEEWRRNVRMLCKACSEGNPDRDAHAHEAGEDTGPRAIGLAARPEDVAEVLDAWSVCFPALVVSSPEKVS